MQVGEEKSVIVNDTNGNAIEGVFYKISDKHRNKQNQDASYWNLDPDQEYELFKNEWIPCWITLPNMSVERVKIKGKWKKVEKYNVGVVFGAEQYLPKDAYALCIVNGAPIVVGRTKVDQNAKGNSPEEKRHDAIFVRFESDKNTGNKKWHGYPAAPGLNEHDIPASCYLKYWVEKNYLSNATVRRLLNKVPRKK